MARKLTLALVAVVGALGAVEWLLRAAPGSRHSAATPTADVERPEFVIDPAFGYEMQPSGFVRLDLPDGPQLERLNSEGWRGPEIAAKADGTLRVVALGDSIVLAGTVALSDTWEQQVASQWAATRPDRIEVINAGIGGYVAWQARSLFERRVKKLNADWVIVHVDWNDLIFSSQIPWHRRINLAEFEQAVSDRVAAHARPPSFAERLSNLSAAASLIRETRNTVWNRRNAERIIESRKGPSGLAFNQPALDAYVSELHGLHASITSAGSRMALLLAPALLTRNLMRSRAVDRLCLTLYANFPLSTEDFVTWHERYRTAQWRFLDGHPDVIPIDVDASFKGWQSEEERLPLFTDHVHLTRQGMTRFAEAVYRSMARLWAVQADAERSTASDLDQSPVTDES